MPQTLQCPRCRSAVAVADDAGGTRVICPHCQQQFLVPGFAAGESSDEDDWLTLKDPSPLKPPAKTDPAIKSDQLGESDEVIQLPPLSSDFGVDAAVPPDEDWFNLDTSLSPVKPRPSVHEFSTDALDDWGTKPPPPGGATPAFPGTTVTRPFPVIGSSPTSPSTTNSSTGSSSTGNPADVNAPAAQPSATLIQPSSDGGRSAGLKAAQAVSVEYESEFMIRCPICSSQVGVSAQQAGKQVRCRDCHSMLQVPPPPRKKKKVVIDIDAAETVQFTESKAVRDDRPADPFRRSAEDLLAAASKVEADTPPPNYDVPKIGEWLGSIFGIFRQLGVVVHWLILSTFASIAAFIALALDQQILVMALFPMGIFFAAMVLACGFTIMQSISNDEKEITDWPLTLQPTEWLAPMVFCFAAAGLACGPGWLLGQMAFGPGLATVFVIMVSIFFIFPFVLLSMLDMQNILMPFSPEVGRSVTRCEEAWGGFYFSSLLIFFMTFLWFVVASLSTPPITAALSIPIAVAATFVYFALLGRLAFAIGQNVNEAPMVNDIESIRQQERLNR